MNNEKNVPTGLLSGEASNTHLPASSPDIVANSCATYSSFVNLDDERSLSPPSMMSNPSPSPVTDMSAEADLIRRSRFASSFIQSESCPDDMKAFEDQRLELVWNETEKMWIDRCLDHFPLTKDAQFRSDVEGTTSGYYMDKTFTISSIRWQIMWRRNNVYWTKAKALARWREDSTQKRIFSWLETGVYHVHTIELWEKIDPHPQNQDTRTRIRNRRANISTYKLSESENPWQTSIDFYNAMSVQKTNSGSQAHSDSGSCVSSAASIKDALHCDIKSNPYNYYDNDEDEMNSGKSSSPSAPLWSGPHDLLPRTKRKMSSNIEDGSPSKFMRFESISPSARCNKYATRLADSMSAGETNQEDLNTNYNGTDIWSPPLCRYTIPSWSNETQEEQERNPLEQEFTYLSDSSASCEGIQSKQHTSDTSNHSLPVPPATLDMNTLPPNPTDLLPTEPIEHTFLEVRQKSQDRTLVKSVFEYGNQGMSLQSLQNDQLRFSMRDGSPPVIDLVTPIIGRNMHIQEVIAHLVLSGCPDLTGNLSLVTVAEYPVCYGGLSDVFRGNMISGEEVAIKALRMCSDNFGDSKHLKRAARELYTWSSCKHPNVHRLLGLAQFRGRIGMISPWMKNGSLLGYLKVTPGADLCKYCAQIAHGLTHLHQIGIIHGDLKGANVLVLDDGTPVLGDFGNSLFLRSGLAFTATTQENNLTVRWAAPELLGEMGKRSQEADVYALGMTILEIITGKLPYDEASDLAVVSLVHQRKYPRRPEGQIPTNSRDGNKLWELLLRCWMYEPENRPTATEVATAMDPITTEGLRLIC